MRELKMVRLESFCVAPCADSDRQAATGSHSLTLPGTLSLLQTGYDQTRKGLAE